MTKYTEKEQEELFARNCKLINLRYEYLGYNGSEKWAIITELSEEQLQNTYPAVICRYMPFILLSVAQGEVIQESKRNADKYEKRAKRTIDMFGYEDDVSEQFHNELITPFSDPFDEAEEAILAEERERVRLQENEKVRIAIRMLQPIQRRRLIKNCLLGQNSREIAIEEGVNYSAVDKSIAAAKKNFQKFYENL